MRADWRGARTGERCVCSHNAAYTAVLSHVPARCVIVHERAPPTARGHVDGYRVDMKKIHLDTLKLPFTW